MDQKEVLGAALDALDRLLKMFTIERYVYLGLTTLSFIILLYTGYLLLTSKAANEELMIAVFGSSGLITASSARISWFFNRSFTLIENLIKKLTE